MTSERSKSVNFARKNPTTMGSHPVGRNELQTLNNRFVANIDRVMLLEKENARLTIELTYQRIENDDQIDKRIEDKAKMRDLKCRQKALLSERNKFQRELADSTQANANLKKKYEDLYKFSENETLARYDLEKNIRDLKKELVVKEKLSKQELTETRAHLAALQGEYEIRLCQERIENGKLCETKLNAWKARTKRHQSVATVGFQEERKDLLIAITRANASNAELKTRNAELSARVVELEKLLSARVIETEKLLAHESEVIRQQLNLESQNKLTDNKGKCINVLNELTATPKRVLRSDRLKSIDHSVQTVVKRSKRKWTVIEGEEEKNRTVYSTASGYIKIIDVHSNGKYIKLLNHGKEEVLVGNWKLVRRCDEKQSQYKMSRGLKLDAGQTMTIWSSDSGATHEPPTNIVWKEGRFLASDEMTTHLIDSNGTERAFHEQKSNQKKVHREFAESD